MAQISSNKCAICTENEGTVLCYECHHHLCYSCRAWHDKFPATKLHTVVDSSQVDKVFSTTKLLCENHNHLYIHYCLKCCCLTCAACVTSDHQSHPFTDVSKVSAQARSEVKEYIDDIKTKVKQHTDLSDNIRSHRLKQDEEDKKTFTNAVKFIVDEFRYMISSIADIFTTRATDHLVLRQHYFQDFLDKTDKLSEGFQLVCTKLECALTETHDVAFYVQYKTLNKEYEELDEIPQLEEPEAIGEFKEEEFTASVVDKIQEKNNLSLSSVKVKDKEIQNLTDEVNNEREKANSLLKSKDKEIQNITAKLTKVECILKSRDKEVTKLENDLEKSKSSLKSKNEDFERLLQLIKNNNENILAAPSMNWQIIVYVNSLNGKTLSILIHTHDKIRKVKEMLETREGIPVVHQILSITGASNDKLKDHYAVVSYRLQNGSRLDLRRAR